MKTNPFATRIETVMVDGKPIDTDQEGYIQDMSQWSEGFAKAQAAKEGLELTQEHWDVIYYIREYYEQHSVQAEVRKMIKYFKEKWGPERGTNHHLHDLFPYGGPQKQGNRVAGIRRTKGEH
ncbi:MAG: TusE/DsrC/DsvC family sulfur relay protein [Gammaproteobacteria bacterium]|nr:TusE/DsrC/DsvC family sulfur relay protein [Gammaproteobacteria bacterium]MCW8982882.1 TusE/DsrC/DsvC family sulfur relay protein [Gammaproteobacteria bacterium]